MSIAATIDARAALDGEGGRFLHRSGREIAELLNRVPLLSAERRCRCLAEGGPARAARAAVSRCPDCGRVWRLREGGSEYECAGAVRRGIRS